MTYNSHYIVTTDRYGVEFLDHLTKRILDEYGFPERKPILYSCRCDGGLNKINTIIELGYPKCEVIIIFFDLDKGRNNGRLLELKDKISKHDKGVNVKFIEFEHEIEDWILKGNGGTDLPKFNPKRKSSKQITDYKKRHLPKYAFRIDLELLRENDENFKKFFEILDP